VGVGVRGVGGAHFLRLFNSFAEGSA
jgi:hypothetical protein